MTSEDTPFTNRVRTTPTCPFDTFIPTVEAAIDAINDVLSDAKRALDHWQRARFLLYSSLDMPKDEKKLAAAEMSFRDALKVERWLNDIPRPAWG